MKSRLFYFLISGIIILSVCIWTYIWHNQHIQEVSTFKGTSFTAPTSSKYIPINADIVLHWKVNPTILPEYIENHQDNVNKNITNKKVKLIRDSFFKLISLDFKQEVSSLTGGYGSLAIFETNKQLLDDWLLILETNKDINIDEELESILDPDIIDENGNPIKNLNPSKLKLFSKKITSNKSIYFLHEKEHILISSNPEVIEYSIANLGKNILNAKEKYKNIQLKDNLNDGIILLELSPAKILNIVDQKKDILGIDQTDKLISSLNIENKQLTFEGILSYDVRHKRPINEINYNLSDIEKEFNSFDNWMLIDNPKQYLGKFSSHPYQKSIASVIKKSTSKDYSRLFKIILENTNGNLIWLKDQDWLAITRRDETDKKEINRILGKDKFTNSNLEFKNKILEVWSKISTNINEKYEIKENIEAIIEENKDVYIWSQNLSSISNFDNKKYALNKIDSEIKDNDFDDIIKIHLGKEKTQDFLNNFYPYILLKTMLGNQLDFPQDLNLSLAIPTINYPDFLKFKVKLRIS
tara:strand:- start:238 stop:1815 length:1578 start_codon:yes stop_codon:yes gene_type:complete